MPLGELSMPVGGSFANLSVSGLDKAMQVRLVSLPSSDHRNTVGGIGHELKQHAILEYAGNPKKDKVFKAYDLECPSPEVPVKPTEIVFSMQDYNKGIPAPVAWSNPLDRCGHGGSYDTYYVTNGQFGQYAIDADGKERGIGAARGNTADHLPYFGFDQPDKAYFLMTFKKADGQMPDQAFPIDLHVALLDKKNNVLFNGNSTALFYNDASLEIFHHQDPSISDTAVISYGINPYFTVTWSTNLVVGVDEPKETVAPALNVYPNPASDEITIQRQSIEPAKFYLYTSQGTQVGEINMKEGETDKKVNLRNLPSGELWITDRKHGLPLVIVR